MLPEHNVPYICILENVSFTEADKLILVHVSSVSCSADENPDELYFQEVPVWKREFV